MSSEALLENPALFCRNVDPNTKSYLDQTALAYRYLDLCVTHPPSKAAAMMRPHLLKMLHNGLRCHEHLRDELLCSNHIDDYRQIVEMLVNVGWEQPAFHTDQFRPELSWYSRYRYVGASESATVGASSATELDTRAEGCAKEEIARLALEKRERKRADKKRRRNNRRDAKLAKQLSVT